ncbi:ficolin-2-like [Saccostrea echinata]|uniref:ficolin-2-like n=1 Tax=Saccostrea echinata TaxID=191078 RepID=UPI002A82365F|nr:ficolin-2-like [Saccostrea echinata]
MSIFCNLFLMAVSLQSAAALSRRYLEDVNFDEKKSEGGSIAEYNDSSLTFCSAKCDVTCGCFGFNLKERKCRIHYSFDQTYITVAEAGWKNYFSEGNDVIHKLTKGRNSSLYVSITLKDGRMLYEYYDQFSVSDESDNYRLFLGGPATGTLGDSMFDQSGMPFSTRDRDNDNSGGPCAGNYEGGWWMNACYKTFLNGPWSPGYWKDPWAGTVADGKDITETLMMIKPH